MNIDEFLTRFVEGYLFHDLESMATLTVPQGQDDGAAGYPMIATVMSGIELLGGFISQSPFSNTAGNGYFLDYWDRCLAITNLDYKNLGELFRRLVRHGLAHTFLAKHGIYVTKRNQQTQAPTFNINATREELIVDCVDFFNDFKKSYQEHIYPIVFLGQISSLTNKATMQLRLDEMTNLYETDSKNAFADYGRRMPMTTTTMTSSSGASLPLRSVAFSGVPQSNPSTAFNPTISGTLPKKNP